MSIPTPFNPMGTLGAVCVKKLDYPLLTGWDYREGAVLNGIVKYSSRFGGSGPTTPFSKPGSQAEYWCYTPSAEDGLAAFCFELNRPINLAYILLKGGLSHGAPRFAQIYYMDETGDFAPCSEKYVLPSYTNEPVEMWTDKKTNATTFRVVLYGWDAVSPALNTSIRPVPIEIYEFL